jgi:cyclophilin family peptidyl-prolyl cis-trans isomerase
MAAMKPPTALLVLLLCLTNISAATTTDDEVRVRMVTTGGTFNLKLFPRVAPRTVAQFEKLIRAGVFNTVYFYRVEHHFVAQTATAEDRERPLSQEQRATIKPIPLEVGALRHTRGVLSLAHGDDPNSGETSFSILLADAPNLDKKFTIFGMLDDSDTTLERIEKQFDQHARSADGKRLQIVKMEIVDPIRR